MSYGLTKLANTVRGWAGLRAGRAKLLNGKALLIAVEMLQLLAVLGGNACLKPVAAHPWPLFWVPKLDVTPVLTPLWGADSCVSINEMIHSTLSLPLVPPLPLPKRVIERHPGCQVVQRAAHQSTNGRPWVWLQGGGQESAAAG
ncbi:hypothetical protein HaLaN_28363 [Haematococcus lacustris]|uniref:Uncharacterized protein n=1 Tax=Haematococcus lacustris TaxID=44745 RepID=A0A6A0ACX1_HAELA|nr:hypothetical protein HaLaN_28363 [Haematococcus lacustris]